MRPSWCVYFEVVHVPSTPLGRTTEPDGKVLCMVWPVNQRREIIFLASSSNSKTFSHNIIMGIKRNKVAKKKKE